LGHYSRQSTLCGAHERERERAGRGRGHERRATCARVGLSAAGWGRGLGLLLFAALSPRLGGLLGMFPLYRQRLRLDGLAYVSAHISRVVPIRLAHHHTISCRC